MSQKTVEPAGRQGRQAECASGQPQGWSDTRWMGLRSEFGLSGRPDGVPGKMQKAIRALRERCLASDRLRRRPLSERTMGIDRGGKGEPLGANQWCGGELG